MKVLFPLVSADSGADIFTSNLVSGLNAISIKADIQYLPVWSGFYPRSAGWLHHSSGYDIVHANMWNGFGFKNDIPLMVTEYHIVHDPLYAPYCSPVQKLYYNLIYRYERKSLESADQVTTISRYTRKKLEEVFGYSDSHMIYCGIDRSLFTPSREDKAEWNIDEETTVLLYVGNHLRRKGADLLEPIMRELGDDFLLLTTAGLRTRQQTLADNIRSLGRIGVRDLVRVYNLCDMLLFPSRLEGFGLCVAEAMACGRPVVTTNTSSLPELVEQDKGGVLCEIDDVSGFAQAVRYLSEDENLRKRMGAFNLNRVKSMFDRTMMVNNYADIYHTM